MPPEPLSALHYLVLFGGGLVAGTLNVIAGGGSMLTLPLMIFMGLPPTVANGTNRVAILTQNVAAVTAFRRHGVRLGGWLRVAAPAALVGAGLGTWLGVRIADDAFQRVLAGVMVAVAVWMLWRPPGRDGGGDGAGAAEPPRTWSGRAAAAGAFFVVGAYGGFIQAGVGFVILAVTSAAGLDLVRGNALKVTLVLIFTPLALAGYWLGGLVEWAPGLALGAGTVGGGLVGVRLTVLKGHAWVRKVVTVMVVLFAIRLWVGA